MGDIILIKNTNLISMSSNLSKLETNINILIENGKIKQITKDNISVKKCTIINGKNKYVIPGLINCHTHIPMQLFKETTDGLNLQSWLSEYIWPVEANLTEEDIYNCSLLGMYNAIDTGTTTINDMYFKVDAILKAAKKSKINMFYGCATLLDVDGEEGGKKRLEEFERVYKKYPENIQNCTGTIHGLYTSSPKYLNEELKYLKEKNLPIHMHFCENTNEVNEIKKRYNVQNPTDVIKNNFQGCKLILAHGVKLTKYDLDVLKTFDSYIVHNPTSNLRLGCGIADIDTYLKNGNNVCLGTDGDGSGSNCDMFKEIRLACLLQKAIHEDPMLLDAYTGLKLATIEGAKALGIEKNKGSIEIGKDADLIILDFNKLITSPVNNVFANIVYNTMHDNIETVIIGGNIVKNNNKHVDVNINELIKKVETIKKRLIKNEQF